MMIYGGFSICALKKKEHNLRCFCLAEVEKMVHRSKKVGWKQTSVIKSRRTRDFNIEASGCRADQICVQRSGDSNLPHMKHKCHISIMVFTVYYIIFFLCVSSSSANRKIITTQCLFWRTTSWNSYNSRKSA